MSEPLCLICEKPGDQCACEPHGVFDAADLPDAWRTRRRVSSNRIRLADSDQPPSTDTGTRTNRLTGCEVRIGDNE